MNKSFVFLLKCILFFPLQTQQLISRSHRVRRAQGPLIRSSQQHDEKPSKPFQVHSFKMVYTYRMWVWHQTKTDEIKGPWLRIMGQNLIVYIICHVQRGKQWLFVFSRLQMSSRCCLLSQSAFMLLMRHFTGFKGPCSVRGAIQGKQDQFQKRLHRRDYPKSVNIVFF